MKILIAIKQILKGIWSEFYNEFTDAWSGLSLIDFYGLKYWHLKKNHPFIAKLLDMITAISYIFYWIGFGAIFFTATFGVIILFIYNRNIINYWYIYEIVWLIITAVFIRLEIVPWIKSKIK